MTYEIKLEDQFIPSSPDKEVIQNLSEELDELNTKLNQHIKLNEELIEYTRKLQIILISECGKETYSKIMKKIDEPEFNDIENFFILKDFEGNT